MNIAIAFLKSLILMITWRCVS